MDPTVIVRMLAVELDPVARCAAGQGVFGKRYARDVAPVVYGLGPFPE